AQGRSHLARVDPEQRRTRLDVAAFLVETSLDDSVHPGTDFGGSHGLYSRRYLDDVRYRLRPGRDHAYLRDGRSGRLLRLAAGAEHRNRERDREGADGAHASKRTPVAIRQIAMTRAYRLTYRPAYARASTRRQARCSMRVPSAMRSLG